MPDGLHPARRVWIWCGTSSQVPGRRCGDRTEAAARDTKSELAEANDAAQELHGQLQRPSPRAEADRLRQEALDELAGARAAVQTLTGDLTTATGGRDDLEAGVDDQAGELTSVREQPRPPRPGGPTRRPSARTASARQRCEVGRAAWRPDLTGCTVRACDLERQLTATRDELDAADAAQARLEAQLAAVT